MNAVEAMRARCIQVVRTEMTALAIMRDAAENVGRVEVASHRQSDVETCETIIRHLEAARVTTCPIVEAARAWAAAETAKPQPSSTGVGDWVERRAAARVALLAAVEAAS